MKKLTKIHIKRKDIEEEIIYHNKKHFTMVVQPKLHRDKIYKKLDHKETRKTILEGKMQRTDCENQEVLIFCNY